MGRGKAKENFVKKEGNLILMQNIFIVLTLFSFINYIYKLKEKMG